jgi:flagellar basal body-associated protein FliL
VGIGILVIPQTDLFRVGLKWVILGAIPIIVLLAGAVFLMIGVSDVRDKGEEIEDISEGSEKGEEVADISEGSEKGEGD